MKRVHLRKHIIGALAFCMFFASETMMVHAAPGAGYGTQDSDGLLTGAGVDLILGSIGSTAQPESERGIESEQEQESDPALEREFDSEPQEDWGYVNLGIADVSESLNIRAAAGTDKEKVGELPAGAACEILDAQDGWAHIQSGAVEGYVSLDYLATGRRAAELARQNQTLTATVQAQTLRVRKQPDTEHGTWGLAAEGSKFEVVEVLDSGWVSVVYGDGRQPAYLSGDFVELDYVLDTALSMTEVLYGKGVTDAGVDLANQAVRYVGGPYVYGGNSLTKGTDCSGFTMLLYAQYGIQLSHSAQAQSRTGREVPLSELHPGDLVFYAKNGAINHVAVYIGGGQVCHASNPTNGILISKVNYRTPVCARRLF